MRKTNHIEMPLHLNLYRRTLLDNPLLGWGSSLSTSSMLRSLFFTTSLASSAPSSRARFSWFPSTAWYGSSCRRVSFHEVCRGGVLWVAILDTTTTRLQSIHSLQSVVFSRDFEIKNEEFLAKFQQFACSTLLHHYTGAESSIFPSV